MRAEIMKPQFRKVAIGLLISLSIGALLTASGCGTEENQAASSEPSEATTPESSQTVDAKTANTTAEAHAASVDTAITTATQPVLQPESQPSEAVSAAVEIISIDIDKTTVNVGEYVTFTIKVKGDAQQVSVIYGAAGGDVSTAHMISAMMPQGTSGGVTTWKTMVAAPKGFNGGQGGPGTCFYTGQALSQDDVLTRTTGNLTFTVNG